MYFLLEIFYSSIFNVFNSIRYLHFWVTLFIVFLQYYKIGKMEKDILGIYKRSPLLNTIQSTFFGLLGGILGSTIFTSLRVVIDQRDFLFMLPLSLVLSIAHPRFVCFSYSGGILSLVSLLTGWPDINVTGIMFVVGVLHLVESVLVLLDGDRTKVPVIMEKRDNIVGGFTMNGFWPVPFTIFINRGIPYPSTLLSILGYGDFTLSNSGKKIRESASLLFTFSIILIILARFSIDYIAFKYIAAMFAPLAHEIIIALGKHREKRKDNIFTYCPGGVRILDVLPNTVGEEIGFSPGEIILSINGKRVLSKKDLDDIIYYRPKIISAKVFNMKRGIVFKEYMRKDKGIDALGLIVMPNLPEEVFVLEESKSILFRLLNSLNQKKLRFKN